MRNSGGSMQNQGTDTVSWDTKTGFSITSPYWAGGRTFTQSAISKELTLKRQILQFVTDIKKEAKKDPIVEAFYEQYREKMMADLHSLLD